MAACVLLSALTFVGSGVLYRAEPNPNLNVTFSDRPLPSHSRITLTITGNGFSRRNHENNISLKSFGLLDKVTTRVLTSSESSLKFEINGLDHTHAGILRASVQVTVKSQVKSSGFTTVATVVAAPIITPSESHKLTVGTTELVISGLNFGSAGKNLCVAGFRATFFSGVGIAPPTLQEAFCHDPEPNGAQKVTLKLTAPLITTQIGKLMCTVFNPVASMMATVGTIVDYRSWTVESQQSNPVFVNFLNDENIASVTFGMVESRKVPTDRRNPKVLALSTRAPTFYFDVTFSTTLVDPNNAQGQLDWSDKNPYDLDAVMSMMKEKYVSAGLKISFQSRVKNSREQHILVFRIESILSKSDATKLENVAPALQGANGNFFACHLGTFHLPKRFSQCKIQNTGPVYSTPNSTTCEYDQRIVECIERSRKSEYECIKETRTVWNLMPCDKNGPYVREELEDQSRYDTSAPAVADIVDLRDTCKFMCTTRVNGTYIEIPYSWKNDGVNDCEDGSDEAKFLMGSEKFHCFATGSKLASPKYIDTSNVCDGYSDCDHSEDESKTLCGCKYGQHYSCCSPFWDQLPVASGDYCKDDPTWLDKHGDNCDFYTQNDPGCIHWHDIGQKTHCRQTCNTCPATNAPTAHPTKSPTRTPTLRANEPRFDCLEPCLGLTPFKKSNGFSYTLGEFSNNNTWHEFLCSLYNGCVNDRCLDNDDTFFTAAEGCLDKECSDEDAYRISFFDDFLAINATKCNGNGARRRRQVFAPSRAPYGDTEQLVRHTRSPDTTSKNSAIMPMYMSMPLPLPSQVDISAQRVRSTFGASVYYNIDEFNRIYGADAQKDFDVILTFSNLQDQSSVTRESPRTVDCTTGQCGDHIPNGKFMISTFHFAGHFSQGLNFAEYPFEEQWYWWNFSVATSFGKNSMNSPLLRATIDSEVNGFKFDRVECHTNGVTSNKNGVAGYCRVHSPSTNTVENVNTVGPAAMIVLLAILSSRLDRENLTGRVIAIVGLLIVIVLLINRVQSRLPDRNYATWLELYLFACFVHVCLVGTLHMVGDQVRRSYEAGYGIQRLMDNIGCILVCVLFAVSVGGVTMASKSDDTLGLALLFGVAYTALISIALLYGWHLAHDIHVNVRPRQHGNSDLGSHINSSKTIKELKYLGNDGGAQQAAGAGGPNHFYPSNGFAST